MHTTTTKRELWEQIIASWETSDQSQKTFCQEHGHSYHLFAYWRKKTREGQTEYQDANGNPTPAIQLACYQIGVPTSAIDPEPESTMAEPMRVRRRMPWSAWPRKRGLQTAAHFQRPVYPGTTRKPQPRADRAWPAAGPTSRAWRDFA